MGFPHPGGARERARVVAPSGRRPRVTLLGLDVGTSATKAVVLDPAGEIVAQAERPTDLFRRTRAGPRRTPAVVGQRLLALPRAHRGEIAAVGVSGMVPAVLLLDAPVAR